MIRWPGRIPAGVVNDEIVSVLDLYPTIATFAKEAGRIWAR